MSKRKVEKRIKEGRGTGTGIDYRPWLKIQYVSSLARSARLKETLRIYSQLIKGKEFMKSHVQMKEELLNENLKFILLLLSIFRFKV